MSINPNELNDSSDEFERLADDFRVETYVLRLFVSGMTARSTEAIRNLTSLCEQHLKGRYELEVIDIYKSPEVASSEQIVATPTLVKKLPLPLRSFVGTLSDKERILIGLNLIKNR